LSGSWIFWIASRPHPKVLADDRRSHSFKGHPDFQRTAASLGARASAWSRRSKLLGAAGFRRRKLSRRTERRVFWLRESTPRPEGRAVRSAGRLGAPGLRPRPVRQRAVRCAPRVEGGERIGIRARWSTLPWREAAILGPGPRN